MKIYTSHVADETKLDWLTLFHDENLAIPFGPYVTSFDCSKDFLFGRPYKIVGWEVPLTSHEEDWVFKPSLRQAVQATKL